MTADERDKQIAHLIREDIATVEKSISDFGYAPWTQEHANLLGTVTGLRRALRFIDPTPYS